MELFQYFLTNWEVFLQSFLEGYIEPLVEIIKGVEDLGHQKVKKRPKLGEIVLQRCSSQKESAVSFEVKQDLPSLGFKILDVLSLIQDHVVPFFPPENGVVSHSDLIAGDTNVKRVQLRPSFPLQLSFLSRSKIGHYLESWAPSLKLDFPIHENRSGNND